MFFNEYDTALGFPQHTVTCSRLLGVTWLSCTSLHSGTAKVTCPECPKHSVHKTDFTDRFGALQCPGRVHMWGFTAFPTTAAGRPVLGALAAGCNQATATVTEIKLRSRRNAMHGHNRSVQSTSSTSCTARLAKTSAVSGHAHVQWYMYSCTFHCSLPKMRLKKSAWCGWRWRRLQQKRKHGHRR